MKSIAPATGIVCNMCEGTTKVCIVTSPGAACLPCRGHKKKCNLYNKELVTELREAAKKKKKARKTTATRSRKKVETPALPPTSPLTTRSASKLRASRSQTARSDSTAALARSSRAASRAASRAGPSDRGDADPSTYEAATQPDVSTYDDGMRSELEALKDEVALLRRDLTTTGNGRELEILKEEVAQLKKDTAKMDGDVEKLLQKLSEVQGTLGALSKTIVRILVITETNGRGLQRVMAMAGEDEEEEPDSDEEEDEDSDDGNGEE